MAVYSAYVTRVIDGDTFETSTETIRLAGIDAVEKNSAMGKNAAAYLRTLIYGKHVTIESFGKGFYNRTLASVWRNSDNLYVNRAMVDSGYAKWFKR